MIIRRLYPEADPPLALPEQQPELDALYAADSETWLRLNLIATIDGSAAGTDGTSATVTGGADRRVLGAIRRASDIVLLGARSFRAEGCLLPKAVPLAVVTSSGNLAGHRIPECVEPGRLLVLCPPAARDRARATLAVDGAEFVDVGSCAVLAAAEIILALNSRGLSSIVCEGGPSLAGSLVAAGFVDELCVSTSPTIGGTSLPIMGGVTLARRHLRLRQLMLDDSGFSYARWSLIREPEE